MNRRPLFTNRGNKPLTRAGVTYILKKYAKEAQLNGVPNISDEITPHWLRHSKAMHLLQAGVNLVYIRDILGHTTTQVTEVYARADTKQKRIALENVYKDVIPQVEDLQMPSWERDSKLKNWLRNLGK